MLFRLNANRIRFAKSVGLRCPLKETRLNESSESHECSRAIPELRGRRSVNCSVDRALEHGDSCMAKPCTAVERELRRTHPPDSTNSALLGLVDPDCFCIRLRSKQNLNPSPLHFTSQLQLRNGLLSHSRTACNDRIFIKSPTR